MLKNYLTVAWRNLLKHKGFTAINIVGLSLSMSVCLVLISLIYDHFQYDNFHPESENIYRITSKYKGQSGLFGDNYASSPLPFGKKLKEDYSFVRNYTNMANSGREGEITSPNKVLRLNSWFADERFFEVLGFNLKEGNAQTALQNPYSIVIDEDKASKFFPDGDAIGSMVEFAGYGSFKVTGIVEKPADKSHIQFEALLSLSTIESLQNKDLIGDVNEWEHIWSCYNYLLLKEDADLALLTSEMNKIGSENIDIEDEDHPGYEFNLQGVDDIVPGKLMSNELGFTIPGIMLLFFGMLGLVVIITASINYTNLSIAKSISRAKEIGIRKSNGASKRQILLQFLTESIFIALLSLVGAVIIYKQLVIQFNELWIFSLVGVKIADTVSAYAYFFLFSIILGVFTGIAPALFLSKINVITSLKGSITKIRRKKGLGKYFSGKKILTGIQFGFSIILLISIFLIKDQGDFLVNSNYGFDEENVFYMELQGHDTDIIRSEFSSIPGVEAVSFTSHHPAVGRSHGTGVKTDPNAEDDITIYHFAVEQDYLKVMDLQLLAGNGFPKNVSAENEKFIVINEKAVSTLNLGSPEEAIGEVLIFEDSMRVSVVGVVKDYHWEPLMKSIRPLGLRLLPDDFEFAYFKISGNDPIKTAKAFESKWIDFDESRDFQGGFLDEKLDEFYQFFYDLGGILTLIGTLAIVITSLGFLGMISFELKTKTKEIGIRKVLGADFKQLALVLSRSFIFMIVVAAFVAVPLAIFINGLWIYEMAYYQPISIFNVGPAILIILLLSLGTVLGLLVKNVNQNPVNSLRYE